MGILRRIRCFIRGGLCPTSEQAVLNSHHRTFPSRRCQLVKNVSTTTLPGVEHEPSHHTRIWGNALRQLVALTKNKFAGKYFRKRRRKYHHWMQLVEEEQEDGSDDCEQRVQHHPMKRRKAFSSILTMGLNRFCNRNPIPKAFEGERMKEDGIFCSSIATTQFERYAPVPFLQLDLLDRPDEVHVFQKSHLTERNLAFSGAQWESQSEESLDLPPIMEIFTRHRRTLSSDSSEASSNFSGYLSEVSSLSGWIPNIIEDPLETDFENRRRSYKRTITEDILRRLERPKATILLMDPRKRIFELVQMSYEPEITTVERMLQNLPFVASDYRLASLSYTGFAYKGIHISAPMVPVDIMLEAESSNTPLFAIPEGYTADHIETIGKNLAGNPKVAALLKNQVGSG